jgi:hypothetical protein
MYTALLSQGFSLWRSTECSTYLMKMVSTMVIRMAYWREGQEMDVSTSFPLL